MDKDQADFDLTPFKMDRYPVTEAQFLAFAQKQPSWGPQKISMLFADSRYLSHWKKAGPSPAILQSPVTQVSWFAADAYCTAQGGRLPTVLEWEYVAAASETSPNATKEPAFIEKILAWYSRPMANRKNFFIGQGKPNFYGVNDLHQLIWEWTADFNSVFLTADNRADGDKIANMFCGAGSIAASSKEDYAAFMRYATRSSLTARSTTKSLGFRCVYE